MQMRPVITTTTHFISQGYRTMIYSGTRNWQGQGTFLFSKTIGPVLWPSLLFISDRGSFPGVNRPDSAVHHTLPPSVKVKNEWSKTSTPYISLHGVHKDKSTFTLYVHMQKTLSIYTAGLVPTLGANDRIYNPGYGSMMFIKWKISFWVRSTTCNLHWI